MKQILIFSEDDNTGYELVGQGLVIAEVLGAEVAAIVLGLDTERRASEYLSRGVHKVYLPNSENELLNKFDASIYANAIQQMLKGKDDFIILLGCTRNGKELAGRLSQKLNAGCINDVKSLNVKDGQVVCERYALGGATVMVQALKAPIGVISVMPGTYEKAAKVNCCGSTEKVELTINPSKVRFIEYQSKAGDTVNLTEVDNLVCVGCGFNNREDVELAEKLAKVIGGAVGCSKPVATDRKWFPETRLIGLSGVQCKPQMAIAIGVSGQVQFFVGIREAKTIIAINNDPSATIFQNADYGIVGDLYQVLPKLISSLS